MPIVHCCRANSKYCHIKNKTFDVPNSAPLQTSCDNSIIRDARATMTPHGMATIFRQLDVIEATADRAKAKTLDVIVDLDDIDAVQAHEDVDTLFTGVETIRELLALGHRGVDVFLPVLYGIYKADMSYFLGYEDVASIVRALDTIESCIQ